MVAVTVEVGFLSNVQEEAKLKQVEYQQQLAMAIFEGIGNYAIGERPVLSDD
jgi:N-acetylmuramoyl-L-alanine amidase